jgi:hypothetical protein
MKRLAGLALAAFLCLGADDCDLGVGRHTSVTIGSDGLPLVAYQADAQKAMKVAHCEDLACREARLSFLEEVNGDDTAVATGTDGLALVAYAFEESLRVGHCSDLACGEATRSVVDHISAIPAQIDLAIGSDGLALLSYREKFNGRLHVAHCDDVECHTVTATRLDDDGGGVGRNSELVIGSDGLGLIAYYVDRRGLVVAHCEDLPCSTATFAIVEEGLHVDDDFGLAIGQDGLPLLAYGNHVAHCADAGCQVVDSLTVLPSRIEIEDLAIGRDGLALFLGRPYGGSYQVGHCQDVPCSQATVATLTGLSGYFPALAIGNDGFPFFTYWDNVNQTLRGVHCQDPVCSRVSLVTIDAGT